MKSRISSLCCSIASAFFIFITLFGLQQLSPATAAAQAPQTTGPKIWLGERQMLPMQPAGPRPGAALLAIHTNQPAAAPQPISLAVGDVDGDGIDDLLVGYSGRISIQRGNVDAFAPQSDASFQAIAHGEFPAPFLAQSTTLPTPVNPDFIAVGHFTVTGNNDLVIAAKGGTALYLFPGDGKGNFAAPKTVNLPGAVTAMIGGDLGYAGTFTKVMVGITAPSGPELAIFSGSRDGLDPVAAFPLSATASNFNFGNFGDGGNDLAFLAGGKVEILRASTMKLQQVSLPITATALALGNFIQDRAQALQMALLTADGMIHIVAPSEFDPRAYTVDELKAIRAAGIRGETSPLLPIRSFPVNGWKIVEDINAAATSLAGQPPVMFRTRISDHQMDDIMVLNGSSGLLTVVQHPNVEPGASTFVPAVLSSRPYSGSAVAAISHRINIDGRPGVLAIHQGESAPSMLMPLPDPTFTVNRTDDPTPVSPISGACNGVPNDCSLREAILKANSVAGTDTINIPTGTYTLTLPRVSGDFSGQHGTLEITDSVNIVGAGQATTIIQGGTLANLSDSVDKVMSINEDITVVTSASVSISNLTIQNGRNRGDCCTLQDGFGGAFDFDTGTGGTATLTVQNVTIQNNAVFDGRGGGIALFNVTQPGPGTVTISNSIIQNNNATSNGTCCGEGGGVMTDVHTVMTMSNTQVLNNQTHASGAISPEGGGLFLQGQHTQPQNHISGGVVSGNKAAGTGGGIMNSATLLIDGGTVISNNTSANAGPSANNAGGGGIRNDAFDGLSLQHLTITGNSTAGLGGGIFTGDGSGLGTVSINFSRIAGNTSSLNANADDLANVTAAVAGDGNPVSATDDWWGTNVPSSVIMQGASAATSRCPAAANTDGVCFDPFIVLTNQASPEKIRINQSTTLTADMSKDNHGTAIALANLDQIIGLPVTFASGPLGSIPQAQPETLNASAQATATFNAGGTSGRANPTATVDQETVLGDDSLISSATEAGTTATITTVGAHGFSAGETVVISGVGVGGYNGTFIITAAPTANTFTYTAATAGLGASTGGTANVGIVILEPPQITKTFGATAIAVNGTTTVKFSINNPNVVAINTSFTDTLPTGLQVAATPGVANTCGGTVTATAGAGSISFSNNLTPVGACTISVNITGTIDNTYTNSVTIDSTDAGNGNTSSANLTVINPPTIAKAFGAATIPVNGTTSLTFTVSSTNQNLTLTGVAFTDNLPAGLVVGPTPNLNNTCGGTATAAAGSLSVSLIGATLAPGASCTVSVSVQGTTAGVKNNSVQASSTNGGTGNTSNASITVVGPPVITKAFGAASIPLNGSTSLSFTINNPNTTVALTGVSFSDTLPAGLVISTPSGLTGSCGGGTITATQGTGVISLSGASLAASASCTFSVNVTGITAGTQNNTTGNVTSVEGGTGGTASASINVIAPPSIAKTFSPSTIGLNATTSLTFTITNPAANAVSLTGVAFTDTLPTGLTVASGTATVCGGTLTTTAPTGIALSGATIAANSQCQFSVTVTGAASGQYTNTTGNVTSTNGGTGNTASANLTVASPPSITKVFGAATIPLNGTTSLTFTIQNPNTGLTLNGLAFTDNLPAGLVVAPTPGLSNTCGGTATAAAGAPSVTLSGGTLAASASCTVSVTVQGVTAGVKPNSVSIASSEAGVGNTSNASITVVGAPGIIKAFGAASIPLNGSTSLSFTINNPNTTVALTGVGFSDTLPAGLVISTPNGLTGSCGGGTITATAGTNVISLSGASLAANASCTFAVNVTGITAGTQNNTTGNVTSVEGGTGGTASASINVVAPPSIAKAFNPSTINVNATTSLTFTITNPTANTAALTGVAFTDTLPTGLTVASGTATVCGGTLTTTAPTGIALSGATIAANSQCQFSVTVTGAAAGSFTNTTGNVTSTNGGTGNTASANLTVKLLLPVFSKAFGAASIPLNGSTSLSFTIQNQNPSALSGVAFSDTLPAGLVVATPNGLTGSCGGGTISATAGTNVISLSGGTLAANTSCIFAVNVKGIAAGTQNNTTGNVTSTETGPGATASATINVVAPPSIAKVFNPSAITLNATTSLTFTITNPAGNAVSLTGVAFSDVLPTGLTVASGTATVCGGTLTTTAPTGIALSGATIAANSQCQFSVTVTGAASGQYTNTTGNVTSTNGGTGNTASANLTVATPPTISKTFGAPTILLNGTTSLSFAIANPNTGLALTGVAFTDSLPAGLAVATPNGLSSTCGGTVTAAAGSGSVTLAGGTLAANGPCAISLNVKGVAAGVQNNTTGPISATESGPGAPSNTASITVIAPPAIVKAFGAASIELNGTTTLSFTITNPNTTVPMAGVAFNDTLPAGLAVASPNGLTGSCGTGTIATSASAISLAGGTIAAGGSCTFSINVVGKTAGHKVNTTGTVTSANAGSGNQATATIDVNAPDLAITKTHVGKFTRGQTGAQYTITVSNVGFGPTVGTVTVVDTPPNIVHTIVPTAISGTGWTCTLATLTCTRSDALSSGSSYPPITLTVNIPINIKNVFTNTATVSGGGDVNPNDNTATDTVNLGPPIIMTPHSPEVTISPNGTAQMAISVDVLDPTLGTIFFSCSGPAGGPLCHSNPVLLDAATAPSPTPMTISILTIKSRAALSSASRPGPARRAPLYAMLSFPVFGMVLAGFGAQNKKRTVRWLVLAVLGLALVLCMVGCGGIPHQPPPVQGTPAGTYVITVTATTTGSTATATFNVVVQ